MVAPAASVASEAGPEVLAPVPDRSVDAVHEHELDMAAPTMTHDAVSDGRGSPPSRRSRGPVISPFRAVVAVVVVAAGVLAWQLTRPVGATYRTAMVGTGTAVATLSSVGTITPVNQANLNFAVAGTVSTVNVAVGQPVTAGEVVAALDPVPLQDAVIADEANLASAEATLSTDETSQAASSTPTATLSSVVTSGTGGSGPPTGGGSTGAGSSTVAQLQAKLIADQKREDADAAAASAALAEATSVCTAPTGATHSSSSSPTSTPATGPAPPSSPGGTPTCSQALSAAATAQATLGGDIKTVAADEAALTAALEAASSSAGSGGTSSTGSGATGGATSKSGSSGASGAASAGASTGASASSGGSGNSKVKVVTAEKLALDQADIDVAQAGLDGAQQSLADANLVSTMSGTVGEVTLAVGSSVSAGSSTTTGQIVILGSGSSYQVVTTVPVAKIDQVAVGQQALVTPDSSGTAVPGTVTGIGVLATTSSTSTTYPVTVDLESSSLGLFSGGEAGVSIVTSRASGTTVPTSAVRTQGTTHLVTVVDGSTTKAVRVTVGTVGAVLTQIKSGVSPGQQVSIANLAQPVPPSSTTSTRLGLAGLGGVTGRAGGFGGAGGISGGGFRGGTGGG
jgi:multidrug efflux pump subunit AcrA (membrane-fusion protein)